MLLKHSGSYTFYWNIPLHNLNLIMLSPGPLLPEDLDIREIPFRQGRKLTIALCGKNVVMLIRIRTTLVSFRCRLFQRLQCRIIRVLLVQKKTGIN